MAGHGGNISLLDVRGNSVTIQMDWDSCKKIGEFKAPSKNEDSFLWFCEDHIKIYNQKWDFFDGMSQSEIQNFMYKQARVLLLIVIQLKNMKKPLIKQKLY